MPHPLGSKGSFVCKAFVTHAMGAGKGYIIHVELNEKVNPSDLLIIW